MVEDETGGTCSTCGEDVKGQTSWGDIDIGWKRILQDRQCTYNVPLRCVRVTTVAVRKAISITYSES